MDLKIGLIWGGGGLMKWGGRGGLMKWRRGGGGV